MKKIKTFFNSGMLDLVGMVIGVVLVFEFIVFPGLTEPNTILNIISALIGIVTTLLFIYLAPGYFARFKNIFESSLDEIKLGETELDYIPKEEILKKKRNTKQFDGVKSDEPFVKTRKKTPKPEFPMKPHSKVVKSINKK
jgi:hypothetical protein